MLIKICFVDFFIMLGSNKQTYHLELSYLDFRLLFMFLFILYMGNELVIDTFI